MRKYVSNIKLVLITSPTFLLLIACCLLLSPADAQEKPKEKEVVQSVDSSKTVIATIDSSSAGEVIRKVKVYNPGKAALRSAILPGWGQIYNKKYWKLPIVYGALGTSASIFIYNLKNYRDTRFAYQAKFKAGAPAFDSSDLPRIKPKLKNLSQETLRYYRDEFRRDIDYSVLFFVLLWGLNVVDAAVDAHLKAFDVSRDLSVEFRPGRSQMAGTNGMSLIVHIGKTKKTALLPSRF
jgi:hypothetical protein